MNDNVETLFTGHHFRQLFEKEFMPIMDEYHLRKIEIDVLYLLSIKNGINTAKQLAKDNFISKAHISKAVENLEKMNYIYLEADEHDHRMHHLKLTEESKEVVDKIKEVHNKILNILFEGIDDEQRKIMRDMTLKIISNIEKAVGKQE